MGDAGACRPVLSPVNPTASEEGRKATTLQRGSPGGHMSLAPDRQDAWPGWLPRAQHPMVRNTGRGL